MLHLVTKEDFNSLNSDKHMKITGMNGRFMSCRSICLMEHAASADKDLQGCQHLFSFT